MAKKKPPGLFKKIFMPNFGQLEENPWLNLVDKEKVKQDNAARWKEAFELRGIGDQPLKTFEKKVARLRNAKKKIAAAQKEMRARYRWRECDLPQKSDRCNHSAQKFERGLRRRGYERLGSGAFSTVWAKPNSDRVIKVCRRPDNWIDYMAWANKAGYGGKSAPKLYSFKYYDGLTDKGKPDQFYVAIMERLDKTMSGLPGKHDNAFFHNLVSMAVERGNDKAYEFVDILQPGSSDFLKAFKQQFSHPGKKVVFGYSGYVYGRFDLHGGNFMTRKDGTAVLVDPLCGKSEIKEKRLRVGDITPALAGLMKIVLDKCLI